MNFINLRILLLLCSVILGNSQVLTNKKFAVLFPNGTCNPSITACKNNITTEFPGMRNHTCLPAWSGIPTAKVDGKAQYAFAEQFCKNPVLLREGQPGYAQVYIHPQDSSTGYYYEARVSTDECKDSSTTDQSCLYGMKMNHERCLGGNGGKISKGCLIYTYFPVNVTGLLGSSSASPETTSQSTFNLADKRFGLLRDMCSDCSFNNREGRINHSVVRCKCGTLEAVYTIGENISAVNGKLQWNNEGNFVNQGCMKMTVNKFDVSATCRDEKGEELVSTVNIGTKIIVGCDGKSCWPMPDQSS